MSKQKNNTKTFLYRKVTRKQFLLILISLGMAITGINKLIEHFRHVSHMAKGTTDRSFGQGPYGI